MMNPAEIANIAQVEADLWWYRGTRKILFRMLDPIAKGRSIGRALEAGCGTGYLARLMAGRYGWNMCAIDLDWGGLRHAKGLGLRELAQADIVSLPFADASFDCLLSMDVLVHLPRGCEQNAAREFVRVLKPGGLFVIRVSALDCLRSRHSEFTLERQRFTQGRLTGLFAPLGIRPLRVTYCNSLLLPVAWVKFRLWEPLTRQPPASGVRRVPGWLDTLLYSPLAAEASWIGSGGSFPAGQSLVLIGEKI